MRLLVLIQAMLFLRKASMILMMICSEAFVVPICLSPWLHPLLKTPFYEILVFKNLMILLTGSSRPPAFAGVLMKTEEACYPN